MIVIGEKKAVICKGDFHPAALYKGDKKITGYTVENFEAENGVVLENCYNDKVYEPSIQGKNLLDVASVYPDCVNDEGGITFTQHNLRGSISSKNMCSEYKENTRYTFFCDYESLYDNNSVFLVVRYTDGTSKNFYNSLGFVSITEVQRGRCKVTTASGKTVLEIGIGYSTVTRTTDVKLTNMMLVEGAEELEYEPPCREATITARGKNLLNISAIQENHSLTIGGVNISVDSNTQKVKVSGTAKGNGGRFNYVTKITLPAGTYYFSTNTGGSMFALTNIESTSSAVAWNNRSFTLTETTTLGLGFNIHALTVH